jgi:uncharacterized HhH-GPD family protein
MELHSAGTIQVGGSFTDHEQADALVRSDPNAFLLGVLFTQGIPAERAWAGPYLLSERLGHLDLGRLRRERASVAEAVARPPALHRFVHTLPGWLSAAAGRLSTVHGKDASRIWTGEPHVREVMESLLAFDGIGPKKAAMAVELLARALGVAMSGREAAHVAYDVHVRRVFLRSGLADEDVPQAIQDAARQANRDDPALLDLPTWHVGRTWCHPRSPECAGCALGTTCEMRTEITPAGVGVRGTA